MAEAKTTHKTGRQRYDLPEDYQNWSAERQKLISAKKNIRCNGAL
jgi:uncharacterized protein (DUF3820 family)